VWRGFGLRRGIGEGVGCAAVAPVVALATVAVVGGEGGHRWTCSSAHKIGRAATRVIVSMNGLTSVLLPNLAAIDQCWS